MHFLPLLSLLTTLTSAKLLVDFNATRGDDPRVIGQLNLQADRANTIAYKSADLFFNKGQDWKGHPAAHVHRKQDYIRAEYHALKNKTKQGETYWIGYTFALEEIQQSLMIWQWKEYASVHPLPSLASSLTFSARTMPKTMAPISLSPSRSSAASSSSPIRLTQAPVAKRKSLSMSLRKHSMT